MVKTDYSEGGIYYVFVVVVNKKVAHLYEWKFIKKRLNIKTVDKKLAKSDNFHRLNKTSVRFRRLSENRRPT